MNSPFAFRSFDSDCGRWTVISENVGDDWFLVNHTTGERQLLSADMEEALAMASEMIKA